MLYMCVKCMLYYISQEHTCSAYLTSALQPEVDDGIVICHWAGPGAAGTQRQMFRVIPQRLIHSLCSKYGIKSYRCFSNLQPQIWFLHLWVNDMTKSSLMNVVISKALSLSLCSEILAVGENCQLQFLCALAHYNQLSCYVVVDMCFSRQPATSCRCYLFFLHFHLTFQAFSTSSHWACSWLTVYLSNCSAGHMAPGGYCLWHNRPFQHYYHYVYYRTQRLMSQQQQQC